MRKKNRLVRITFIIILTFLLLSIIGICVKYIATDAHVQNVELPAEASQSEHELPAEVFIDSSSLGGPGSGESSEVSKWTVVIDAGHQKTGNFEKEPIGPNSSEMKNKVAGGTQGVVTGKPEYELNLEIAKKLQEELEGRGYDIIMTRETNDVNISNAERAQIANDSHADILIHIHANGSENSNANGMMTICQTSKNPYNSETYEDSYKLSELILDAAVSRTGAHKEYIWETDNMSGINWSKIPSSIIEVGYLTNANEEQLLLTSEYQNKIAVGIADGIDAYFENKV